MKFLLADFKTCKLFLFEWDKSHLFREEASSSSALQARSLKAYFIGLILVTSIYLVLILCQNSNLGM